MMVVLLVVDMRVGRENRLDRRARIGWRQGEEGGDGGVDIGHGTCSSGGQLRRFSELERAIPKASQKMLIQQLREMEADGLVRRIVHHQVPPKVEYGLTGWGQALCPALDALLFWAGQRSAADPQPE